MAWEVITSNGEKQTLSDIQYDNRIGNGVVFADETRISDDSKDQASQMNKDIRVAQDNALIEEVNPLTKYAIGASKFIAPDAYEGTVGRINPTVGVLKSLGKGALTAGSLAVGPELAALPTLAKYGSAAGLGLANYLGGKAIDLEAPTLSGSALGAVEGLAGQGVMDIGAKLFKIGFNAAEKYIGSLPIATKTIVYDRIQNAINKLVSSATKTKTTINANDIKTAVDNLIDESVVSGNISKSESKLIKNSTERWIADDQVLENVDQINARLKALRGSALRDDPFSYALKGTEQARSFVRQGLELSAPGDVAAIKELQNAQKGLTSPGSNLTDVSIIPAYLSPAIYNTGKLLKTAPGASEIEDYLGNK